MSDLWKMWNPFSKKVSHTKRDAEEDRNAASEIHADALAKKARTQKILNEQKMLSEELRREQRRNHFGDLFQTAIPLRHPTERN